MGGVDIARPMSSACRKARRSSLLLSFRFESETLRRSRSETTPTSFPPWTTGMCRTPPSRMISSTVDSESPALIVTSFSCMMSRTRAFSMTRGFYTVARELGKENVASDPPGRDRNLGRTGMNRGELSTPFPS